MRTCNECCMSRHGFLDRGMPSSHRTYLYRALIKCILIAISAWMSCTMCVDVHGSAARKKRTLGGCLECAIMNEELMDGRDNVRCDDHDAGIHFGGYEFDIIGHFEL